MNTPVSKVYTYKKQKIITEHNAYTPTYKYVITYMYFSLGLYLRTHMKRATSIRQSSQNVRDFEKKCQRFNEILPSKETLHFKAFILMHLIE